MPLQDANPTPSFGGLGLSTSNSLSVSRPRKPCNPLSGSVCDFNGPPSGEKALYRLDRHLIAFDKRPEDLALHQNHSCLMYPSRDEPGSGKVGIW